VTRLLLILIACLVLVLFCWNNSHHVEVGLIFGRPVHVRLVFLLLTTFLIGHFTAVLLSLYMRFRIKARVEREKTAQNAQSDEDDEFSLD